MYDPYKIVPTNTRSYNGGVQGYVTFPQQDGGEPSLVTTPATRGIVTLMSDATKILAHPR